MTDANCTVFSIRHPSSVQLTHPTNNRDKTMIWNIDASHTNVDFAVKHMAISTVRGSFNVLSATGETNDAGFPTALSMEIDAASVSTNNEQRDGHLKSPDFFDVAA